MAIESGSGSEFIMSSNGANVQLSIYLAKATDKEIGVEFYFKTGSIYMPHMWQQFSMKRDSGAIRITEGYMKLGKMKPVEKMTQEDMNINKQKGVELNDFLFSKKEEISKDFIAEETIEIPAGTIRAAHYRKVNNGQTVDFWISEQVKPIGLVKLVSKSKKQASHNYTIELNSLLKNVAAEIDPSQSIPMSDRSRETLQIKK